MTVRVLTFVIHLRHARLRHENAEKIAQESRFPAEIIDAIDATEPNAPSLDGSYRPGLNEPVYPFPLRRTEVACFLSHRLCWQKIIDEGCAAGLVIEDDVKFVKPEFDTALDLALKHFASDSYIRFPIKAREKPDRIIEQRDGTTLFRPRYIGRSCCCQLVGREAAKRLLDASIKFDRPVDTFIQMPWITGIQTLTIIPAGVCEISNEIGGSTIHQKKPPRTVLRSITREARRSIYRWRLRRAARTNNIAATGITPT